MKLIFKALIVSSVFILPTVSIAKATFDSCEQFPGKPYLCLYKGNCAKCCGTSKEYKVPNEPGKICKGLNQKKCQSAQYFTKVNDKKKQCAWWSSDGDCTYENLCPEAPPK